VRQSPPQKEKEDPLPLDFEIRDRIEIHLSEGNKALAEKRLEKAEQLFKKVLALSPGNSRALFGVGMVAFKRRQYDEAAEKMASALERSPGKQEWRNRLGLALLYAGKRDQALTVWRQVVKMDPGNPKARRYLAKAGEPIDDGR
jgi:tetratricopeptide (TPR) repeat protein